MRKLFIIITLCLIALPGFSQDIVIDAKNKDIDSIVVDLLLDKAIYTGNYINIININYAQFGLDPSPHISFTTDFFKDNETYVFNRTNTMDKNHLYFFFHPSSEDRDARRFCYEIVGKRSTAPRSVEFTGRFIEYRPYTSSILGTRYYMETTYYLFIVTRLMVQGTTYTGILPPRGIQSDDL